MHKSNKAKEKKDIKFDKRAAVYDDHVEGRVCERFYRLVTENVKLTDGAKVLDAGCGTGTVLKRLSEKCQIDGYGIDIEDKMLEQAKKKCPKMNLQKCSCTQTPFETAGFDCVIACMTFHHFEDQSGFAKEAARILKPGGKLYLADPRFLGGVRQLVNWGLRRHNINGKFHTVATIHSVFAPYGFRIAMVKKKGFAQLIVIEKA